ncbi:hypothetical protein PNIG_a2060 [Pseudoalteromonas nigrifaciens]|uniref:Uncharacterized protein n=1 Tax=Pseudoalteromonas nigrifaciens TaxID=28109 RepID=A0AAC9UGJ4_9GAMM|nr:hypothetical protein [Pseudoalteromonas nigrifaciens]ASM54120.1 hypothetical protein PNIG_a2060 [Pseudoalteromonas nigrifaciens]GEN42566.1 hypothetical protein PNI02_20320 [Pseudoalteromonas nigrifaciens]SUC52049.1 Uncharacterised protein [Pseudoalteromonas nigrifaciens]
MINKIVDFIVLDEEQTPVLDEQGLPQLLQRPDTKTEQDIERLISLGKPTEVITKFAVLVSLGEQWNWAQEYFDYLVELNEVNEHNANLPEPIANDEGTVIEAEPKPLPIESLRPEVRTVEHVLAPYQRKLSKMVGIEIKGVNVSLNETNQNGLSALKSAFDLATEFDAQGQFFPIKFNAETATGEQVVELADEAEFKQFGLQFILARKSYFE